MAGKLADKFYMILFQLAGQVGPAFCICKISRHDRVTPCSFQQPGQVGISDNAEPPLRYSRLGREKLSQPGHSPVRLVICIGSPLSWRMKSLFSIKQIKRLPLYLPIHTHPENKQIIKNSKKVGQLNNFFLD